MNYNITSIFKHIVPTIIAISLLTSFFPSLTSAHEGHVHSEEHDTTTPVVSIGSGNSNIPRNIGPAHDSFVRGSFPVYATIMEETALDNYHFRVVKEGESEGYSDSCNETFDDPENFGYGKCGYIFHMHQYADTPFTNKKIADLDTLQFTGDGKYFLIIGALDQALNRTNSNFLLDPRVAIIVDNTAPTSVLSTPTENSEITANSIFISGTTTDANRTASTTIEFANYSTENSSCGEYSHVTTLNNSTLSREFAWSHIWTPENSGVYCIKAHGEDSVGNKEYSPFVKNVKFKKISSTTLITNSSENSGGGGSGGSSSGGNGPIVGFVPGGNGPLIFGVNASNGPSESNKSNSNIEGDTNNLLAINSSLAGLTDGDTVLEYFTDNNSPVEEKLEEKTEKDSDENKDQIAGTGFIRWNNWYLLWIFIIILIVGVEYFLSKKK